MNETELKIKIIGDPILRKKARAVVKITDKHKQFLSKMAQLMYESKGIGLAAPQAGSDEAMIVVDIGKGLYKLINPCIVSKKGTQALEEGCLSVPGASIKVRRSKKVKVQALDEDGRQVLVEAEDLLACVLQHEIDHLKGKLIIDYASFVKRLAYRRKMKSVKTI